jgi:hypothetical protein
VVEGQRAGGHHVQARGRERWGKESTTGIRIWRRRRLGHREVESRCMRAGERKEKRKRSEHIFLIQVRTSVLADRCS